MKKSIFTSWKQFAKTALAFFMLINAGSVFTQQLAFPGAEGFGRYTLGGRGGTVYHVTNLNDAGAGSFRDAVSAPNRTVVFDVGGIINITTRIVVHHHVTVAGQTAPGGGITIYGNGIAFNGDSGDDIIRYIRIRMGKKGDITKDAVAISEGQNYIFDHVSVSWGRDGTFDINGTGIDNVTIQNSIIGQGINLDNHSTGGLMQSGKLSLLRTLFIDNKTRNPKGRGTQEYINNVIYNWATDGYILGDTEGLSEVNMMGNYFISGPSSTGGCMTNATSAFHVYASQNYYDSNKNGTLDGALIASSGYGPVTFQTSPYSYPGVSNLMTPVNAYNNVISNVGPYKVRDAVDNLLISQLNSKGTQGAIITTEDDNGISGNVGTVANGTPATDSDGDGMSNAWESANGTNPNVADNNGDLDGDGFTNIEEYLDYVANGTVTVPASLTKGGSGSSSQTVTVGTAIASFYYTWANATSVTVSGLPSGVTSIINTSAKTVTISGTPNTAGTYNYTVTTTGGSPNASTGGTLTVDNGSGTSTLIYQGESASIVSGVVESTNSGYTGTGYANTNNAIGNYVEFTVTTTTAGSFTILFRYASVGDRPADIYVNGTKVISVMAFPTTTVWTTWTTTATQTVTLMNGVNKIRATATTAGGCANLDYLQVTGSGTLKSADVTNVAFSASQKKIDLYPNPVTNAINLSGSLAESEKVTVSIYNQFGCIVDYKNLGVMGKGDFNVSIPASNIKPGIYILKVQMGTEIKNIGFIKQ